MVNKLDLVSSSERKLLEKVLSSLNPRASLTATSFGVLPSEVVMPAGYEEAAAACGNPACEDSACEDPACGETSQDACGNPACEDSACEDPACGETSCGNPACEDSACGDPGCGDKSCGNPECEDSACEDPGCAEKSQAAVMAIDKLGISSFVYSSRRPFEARRLAALLQQWPRDDASPLQAVSLELGLDVKVRSAEENAAAAAAAALAANPDKPPLRFTIGSRVECFVGGRWPNQWASGKVTKLWYQEAGMSAAVPYQVLLDDARFIFAPADVDETVRAARGDAAKVQPSPFRGVLRSKGWCWLSSMPTQAGFWSHAGRSVELTTAGAWWAATSEAQMREKLGARYEETRSRFTGEFGDCRQELVFIGANMDEAAIRRALDACLLSSKQEIEAFKRAWKQTVA